jgi:hypothetical protein
LQCPVYFAKKLATFYDENALSQRESLRFWLGYIRIHVEVIFWL